MTRLLAVTALLVGHALAPAEDKKLKDAIVTIDTHKEDRIETKDGVATKPTAVMTDEDLKKAIPDEATRERVAKLVDFKEQKLLIFAWQGSGGAKLDYMVLEKFPEIINFTVTPGKTDDLRSHVYLFAVRNNVSWSVK